MTKGSKFNILMFISFIFLFTIVIYSSYNYVKLNNNIIKKNNEVIEMCKNNQDDDLGKKEFCQRALSSKPYKTDFFTTFANIVTFGNDKYSICLHSFGAIIILFIIVPSVYYVCRYLKSGAIVNEVTREAFNKNRLRLFKNAYKPVMILPIVILLAFLISYLYAPNFDASSAAQNGYVGWQLKTLSNPFLFMGVYLLNIFIHSVLFINLSMCVSRKYHNFFVSLILTYLVFLATEIFLEIGFGGILFTSILNMGDKMLMFNIMNLFALNDSGGMLYAVIVPFIIMVITSIVVMLLYKNKEKLIIDCEQENQEEVAA